MIGQTIGHYRILEEISRGGMGIVFKAVDTRLDRLVAIKAIHPDCLPDENSQRRLRREALIVARIDHPFICKIYEALEHEGQLYIVLEYVEGRSLEAQPLESSVRPLEDVLKLGREIAEALEAAHARGIIHRDIKPANIMLLDSGHIKMLDFGLAKPAAAPVESETAAQKLTTPGAIIGTLSYMSPEQVQGLELDARSDIFSLGIVLYELLAGRNPFEGGNPAETAALTLSHDPQPLHRYCSGIPDSLQRVLQRMLAKDPRERYQSVHEVRVELRLVQDEIRSRRVAGGQVGGPASAPAAAPSVSEAPTAIRAKVPATEQARGWRQGAALRSRWTALAVAGLILAGIIVAVLWITGDHPVLSFAPRDWILVTDFENQTGDSLFDGSLATAFTVSLEQSKHANIFPRARINDALRRMKKESPVRIDDETAREICIRENVRGLVSPAISRIGQQYILAARLIDPRTGDTVRSYLERADGQDGILTALTSLAAAIREDLGESLVAISASNAALQRVTTASLTALQRYSEGNAFWSRGKHDEALQSFLEAVQQDPEFAKAHAALGNAYSSHIFSNRSEGRKHFEKALQLAGRTTEREQMTIEMSYLGYFGTFEDTEKLYRVYLERYPDDWSVRYNFGTALRNNGKTEEAIEQYRDVLRIVPNDPGSHINLATCYSLLDDSAQALQHYTRAFELEPEWITLGNLNHEYGFTLVQAGDHEQARDVFRRAFDTSLKPMGMRSMALLDLYEGKYRSAEKWLREAILINQASDETLSEARNHLFLSIVHEGLGDSAGWVRELDEASRCVEKLAPQLWLSCRIGVGYARAGELGKAARVLEKARKQADTNIAAESLEVNRLEGELELARGNTARALELLLVADWSARGMSQKAFTLESLAHAYRRSGNEPAAVSSYEAFIRQDSIGFEPQQAWIGAHSALAELYAERGDKDKARWLADVLLKLWAQADADLPVLKKTRQLRSAL